MKADFIQNAIASVYQLSTATGYGIAPPLNVAVDATIINSKDLDEKYTIIDFGQPLFSTVISCRAVNNTEVDYTDVPLKD